MTLAAVVVGWIVLAYGAWRLVGYALDRAIARERQRRIEAEAEAKELRAAMVELDGRK